MEIADGHTQCGWASSNQLKVLRKSVLTGRCNFPSDWSYNTSSSLGSNGCLCVCTHTYTHTRTQSPPVLSPWRIQTIAREVSIRDSEAGHLLLTMILNKTTLNLASDSTEGQLETQSGTLGHASLVHSQASLLWPTAAPEEGAGHRAPPCFPAVSSSSTGPLPPRGPTRDSELLGGPLQSGPCTPYPGHSGPSLCLR